MQADLVAEMKEVGEVRRTCCATNASAAAGLTWPIKHAGREQRRGPSSRSTAAGRHCRSQDKLVKL